MTVLVTLEHAKLDDVVTRRPGAPPSASRRSTSAPASGSPCATSSRPRSIQSANDAAWRSPSHVGKGDVDAFVAHDEREGARELGLARDALRPPRRARRARPRVERARRDACSRGSRCATRSIRCDRRRPRRARSRAAGGCTRGTTCSATFPGVIGVKTGHTERRRLVAGRRGARPRRHGLRDDPRQPDARAAEHRPRRRCSRWGLSRYRRSTVDRRDARRTRRAEVAVRARRRSRSSRRSASLRSCASTGRSASGSSRRRPSTLPVRKGQRLGDVRDLRRRRGSSRARRSSPRARSTKPGVVGRRRLVREADASTTHAGGLVIVTVTLNAAVDRTLTVPNFQLGHRHRASQGLTLAGGKGINVARALSGSTCPVVATGLAGGRTGDADRRGADVRGDPQRLRPHRRRVADVDGRRRPDGQLVHRDQRVGPARASPKSWRCCATSCATSRAAPTLVVFAGSLPRGVEDDFYAEAIRELNRRGVRTVLDAEGEPLRLGRRGGALARRAEPARGRGARRPGAREDEDFAMALDSIAELGARNVLITLETGCFGLFREERAAPALPRRRAAGRAGLGGRRGRRAARRVPRRASSTGAVRRTRSVRRRRGAASTLELGAGRFDPREANRLDGPGRGQRARRAPRCGRPRAVVPSRERP